MIFSRSALREFTSSGLGVFVVLLAITIITQLIRYLGFAARGSIPADTVLTLLGFSGLGALPLLLSITLFLSVLLSLSRMYRDSEMVVWFSAGAGLPTWFRPVLFYAAPMTAVVAVLSLSLTPWAIRKSEEFRHQIESRDDISTIAPGVFKESKGGERVFFVEKLTSDLSQVSNIFVHSVEHQRANVTVAQRGYVQTQEDGDRYLVMLKGRRYEGTPGNADYRVVDFARYLVRIEQAEAKTFLPTHRSTPTLALLTSEKGHDRGELVRRFGLPISTFILAFFAIPLSAVNPRTGRSFNLILAILLYTVYSNLVNVVNSWVSQGRFGVVAGLVGLNLSMAIVCAILIYHRLAPRPFYRRTG